MVLEDDSIARGIEKKLRESVFRVDNPILTSVYLSFVSQVDPEKLLDRSRQLGLSRFLVRKHIKVLTEIVASVEAGVEDVVEWKLRQLGKQSSC